MEEKDQLPRSGTDTNDRLARGVASITQPQVHGHAPSVWPSAQRDSRSGKEAAKDFAPLNILLQVKEVPKPSNRRSPRADGRENVTPFCKPSPYRGLETAEPRAQILIRCRRIRAKSDPLVLAQGFIAICCSLQAIDAEEDWSGREDLNLRPPGPETKKISQGVDFSIHVSGASTVQTHVIPARRSHSFSYGCPSIRAKALSRANFTRTARERRWDRQQLED